MVGARIAFFARFLNQDSHKLKGEIMGLTTDRGKWEFSGKLPQTFDGIGFKILVTSICLKCLEPHLDARHIRHHNRERARVTDSDCLGVIVLITAAFDPKHKEGKEEAEQMIENEIHRLGTDSVYLEKMREKFQYDSRLPKGR